MNIRLADSTQAAAIAALHASSWRATYGDVLSPAYLRDIVTAERLAMWQQRFARPKRNQFVLVAERDGEISGFACALAGEHGEFGSYLDNLHVCPTQQGRGVGLGLLAGVAAACEQRCPGRGLYLLVNQTNHRAQRFYLALGARSTRATAWTAPDGSLVPAFQFTWPSAAALAERGAA